MIELTSKLNMYLWENQIYYYMSESDLTRGFAFLCIIGILTLVVIVARTRR
jgi:hypothetical protein